MTIVVVCLALAAAPAAPTAPTKAGVVYRVETVSGGGTVWVAGSDARLEPDAKDALPPRVQIWKDGGKQILILNDVDRTYYDWIAYKAQLNTPEATLNIMTVSRPFEIAGAGKIRVDVRPPAAEPTADGCRPVTATFSYELRLRIANTPGTFPGRVEGEAEFCLADSFPATALPFGHGATLTAGIEAVDKVFAERLAALPGVAVRRKISVTRRIENGETVSKTATLELKNARPAEIPADRFEVPPGYRFQEPVITAPTRQD